MYLKLVFTFLTFLTVNFCVFSQEKHFIITNCEITKINGYSFTRTEAAVKEELIDAFLGQRIKITKLKGAYDTFPKYKFNVLNQSFTLSEINLGSFTKYSTNEFRLDRINWYEKEGGYLKSNFSLSIKEVYDGLGSILINISGVYQQKNLN